MKSVLLAAVLLLALAAPSTAAPSETSAGAVAGVIDGGIEVPAEGAETIPGVPEPASLALVGFGLSALAAGLRRRAQSAKS